jgi:uncharacterized protein
MCNRRREFLKEFGFTVAAAVVPSLPGFQSLGQEAQVRTIRGRVVIWAPEKGPGLEHLSLEYRRQDIFGDGVVIGLGDETPFRARYRIHCDQAWRTREVILELLEEPEARLEFLTDGLGHWKTRKGDPVPCLNGCMDVDISVTPFTNTLVIRRMSLKPGDSLELSVAYVSVPAMQFGAKRQRYTCLEVNDQGGRYRFEDVSSEFRADIQVDSDGLVTDYSGLFNRVWPL